MVTNVVMTQTVQTAGSVVTPVECHVSYQVSQRIEYEVTVVFFV